MEKDPRSREQLTLPGTSGKPVAIPDKLYFKIGEVCKLTDTKQHVLRYWESEFAVIRPQRASSKQRLYRRVDVENILLIKRLLQEEGFTIAGAKKFLSRQKSSDKPKGKPVVAVAQGAQSVDQFCKLLKRELLELRALLENK
ncbi:MAG: MerR family transcriptional regulator [Deltaproteobacteria bacterium]